MGTVCTDSRAYLYNNLDDQRSRPHCCSSLVSRGRTLFRFDLFWVSVAARSIPQFLVQVAYIVDFLAVFLHLFHYLLSTMPSMLQYVALSAKSGGSPPCKVPT